MPYSMDDKKKLPSNVQKLPEKLQSQWTSVWNSAHSACMKKPGSDTKKCEQRAFMMANGVLRKRLKSKKDEEEMKEVGEIENLDELLELFPNEEEPETKETDRPVEVELLLDLAEQIKEMTYSEKESKVRGAFAKLRRENGMGYVWPIEVYEDYLICRGNGDNSDMESGYGSMEYYKHPYTWNGDDVKFGKPVKVEKLWKEVKESTKSVDEEDENMLEELSLLDTEVCFGGQVKSLGTKGMFGGWLIKFGNEKEHDISKFKDFFSKQTDFGKHRKTPVYYAHGLDKSLKKVEIGEGTISIKDAGVWLEGQLKLRNAYENMVWKMLKSDKLGLSSGTASHLIEREPQDNGTNKILKWPLGLDASLTPIPADPRIKAMPLKGLYDQLKSGEYLQEDIEEEDVWTDYEDETEDEDVENKKKALNRKRLAELAKLEALEAQLELSIVKGDYLNG